MNDEITLTHRQALICERMMEQIESRPWGWVKLDDDLNNFGTERMTEEEWQQLAETLRGE